MGSKKILIVDDEIEILDIIRKKILANNYECKTASSAEAGIALAQSFRPDLVLLDIVLPDKTGYEVCEVLKDDPRTNGVKILLATGKDLTPGGLLQRCLDLGADDYILKPINLQALVEKIKSMVPA
jgi:DNA-binding response OmpR family regulator